MHTKGARLAKWPPLQPALSGQFNSCLSVFSVWPEVPSSCDVKWCTSRTTVARKVASLQPEEKKRAVYRTSSSGPTIFLLKKNSFYNCVALVLYELFSTISSF